MDISKTDGDETNGRFKTRKDDRKPGDQMVTRQRARANAYANLKKRKV